MSLKKLKAFLSIFLKAKKPKISLLIPFDAEDPQRKRVFKWVEQYWRWELPEAEVVIGHSSIKPFCKTNALNNAAQKARGQVFVIMDADAYIDGEVIKRCAINIIENLDNHLWYVPYRHLYRLTEKATEYIIESSPHNPLRLDGPPPEFLIENVGHSSKYGHRYGAMCMMFHREAYNLLGCFDERFIGWGGEDVALLRALDTLYGKHKTTNNDILHLWHPTIGDTLQSRKWDGQEEANKNNKLANQYHKATRHPSKMRELVDEGCKSKQI